MLKIPVLLSVARLNRKSYGRSVVLDLEKTYGRRISAGAVYAALQRLESDGMITSNLGQKLEKRGGRRRRYYMLAAKGRKFLTAFYQENTPIWQDLEHYLSEHRFI